MPLLTDFQAALFDIDGTLTTTGREVRPATRTALKLLQTKGIVCGFCSGKHYGKLVQESLTDVLPSTSIHVLASGTQVTDGQGKNWWQTKFPKEAVKQILDLANQYQVPCFIKHSFYLYGNEAMFTFTIKKRSGAIAILKPITPEVFSDSLSVGLSDPPTEVIEKLAQIPGISFSSNLANHYRYVDITPKGVTKATGIKHWSKITGIPAKKIIGFGDSQNDIEFLKTVGFAVVLGNATDDIKALAHRVIGHTDEDGLATYLQEICTTGEL